MGERSSIEWTESTWTPIRARWFEPQNDGSGKERVGWHCEHVSEGCRNCYAEAINRRLGTGLDFKPGNLFRDDRVGYMNGDVKLFLDEKMLLAPLRWRRPRRIFVCSMTDLFASFVPDAMIDRVFAIMALCPQHTFQVLTKRPERMRAWFADPATLGRVLAASNAIVEEDCAAANATGKRPLLECGMNGRLVCAPSGPKWLPTWPLRGLWLGTSCEDQKTADARVPELLATPAAIRFVSAEPLLGPIDFRALPKMLGGGTLEVDALSGIETMAPLASDPCRGSRLDWVIVGSESGSRLDWVRSIRDQCEEADVAFFWKQHVERGRKIPTPRLDGRSWVGMPAVVAGVRS